MFLSNSFLIFLHLFVVVFTDDTIVQLPNGKIQGRVATTFHNTTFYAFQEVPYAAPPIGTLRFQAPTPISKWDGLLETVENTKICFQAGGTNSMQNEDCLYLNVYTPVVPNTNENLPVLFFIHGGKFLSGDGVYDVYGPDFFMDTKKVVVVTINYRLGPFGFLSTEDEVIPGNNGLKDQLSALEWVQENIYLFGGDPSKVTIVGQSAGSASVSYHLLSEKSKGMFRAAIMESGTVLTPWSYQRFARSIAYQTAAALDSTFTEDKSSQELLELLLNVSAKELQSVAADVKVPTKHINSGFIFAPVIEAGNDAFVTDYSYELLEKGAINRVPLIVGMNSEEAISQASSLGSLKKVMRTYDDDLSIIVNDDFHIDNETIQTTVGENIRTIYTDGLFQDDLASSVRFISDSRYSINVVKYAQLVSNVTDVYFYQFSYDGDLGNIDAHIDGAESVGHSEELQYLWRTKRNDDISQFSDSDVLTHNRLVELWTNFVTELNPTPQSVDLLENIIWPKVSADNYQYLDIREHLKIETDPKGEAFKAWDSLYQSYGVKPFDTY